MHKTNIILTAAMVGLLIHTPVRAAEDDICRDGYSSMLLTQNECRNWLAARKELEKRGDLKALQQLDKTMQAQMEERAAVCPCTWDRDLKAVRPDQSVRY